VSPGSRVKDAIQAAGGFTQEADPGGLNLAALLQDGDLVWVPNKAVAGTGSTAVPPAARLGAPAIDPEPGRAGGRINLNTATAEALESLPGIGPVTAGKIIAYRVEHGPFATIEAIQDVSGIGPATFAKIQDMITVSELP
jgi:competence protein ComEA